MIMQDCIPAFKTFLNLLPVGDVAREYLARFVTAFAFHYGRMSACAAAEALPCQSRHRGQVSRFAQNSELGDGSAAYRSLVQAALLSDPGRSGRAVIAVDKTNVSCQGRQATNTFSTGNRQRRPRRGRRYQRHKTAPRRCHAFIVALVLLPDGRRIPFHKNYYTREYCAAHGFAHRTEAELAAELIRTVPLPAGMSALVVGDTAYEASVVRDACRERDFRWLTPTNTERVYEGPPPRAKVTGRLKDLSANDFSTIRFLPNEGAYAAQRRVSPSRCGPKTSPRTFYVHEERACVRKVGHVRILFSTKSAPQARQPLRRDQFKILLTDDLDTTVEELIELYDLRWQIELFFKELKSGLGIHQYRFRDFAAVSTWFECGLIAFVYLEWFRVRQLRSRQLTRCQKRWWKHQRTHGVLRYLRQTTEENQLTRMARWCDTRSGVKRLRRVLRAARPPEERKAYKNLGK
jgi:hypothetical protein